MVLVTIILGGMVLVTVVLGGMVLATTVLMDRVMEVMLQMVTDINSGIKARTTQRKHPHVAFVVDPTTLFSVAQN